MTEKNIFTHRSLDSLSELYHTNTKLDRWSGRQYGECVELFNRSAEGLETVFSRPGKTYAWSPAVQLPAATDRYSGSFGELVAQRRSARSFSGNQLKSEHLAIILRQSAGVTSADGRLRSYPSAGAMYPLEAYVVVLSVQGLRPGMYHYSVHDHALRQLGSGDYRDQLSAVLFAEGLTDTAAAAIVLSAIFHRSQIKYGERGYRMILFEAGHLAQNVLLSAVAEGVAAVPIGGFLDDDLNALLGLDGVEESAVYPLLLGVP